MRNSKISLLVIALIVMGMVFGPTRSGIRAGAVSTNNNLGINCAYGSMGSGGAPITTEDGNGTLNSLCQWAGDIDGDGALDPLVSDNPSLLSPGSGGGFTADIIITNLNMSINAFDQTIGYDPHVLDAVLVDQSGLTFGGNSGCGTNPQCTLTAALTIDHIQGQVRVSQALLAVTVGPGGTCDAAANPSCTASTQTLFRIRFDVVGAGTSFISFSTDPKKNVIIDPSTGVDIRHTTQNGALSTNALFALINGVHSFTNGYNASWTFSPNPEVPGSPITFTAVASCGNCTGTFIYSWDFSSQDSPTYLHKTDSTGSSVTITAPPPVLNRVTLTVSDMAIPPHNVSATKRLPLSLIASGPAMVTQGTASTAFTGKWLGGIVTTTSGYSGAWRFCPGSPIVKTVCDTPTSIVLQNPPAIIQTSTVSSATFNFAGLYTDSLQISDTAVSQISPIPATRVDPIAVNVTGATPAYTIAVSSPTTSVPVGTQVGVSAIVTYSSGYPSAFQSSTFKYTFFWGDQTNTTVAGGKSISAPHTYNTQGNFTVKVVAKEIGSNAPSQIQENGFSPIPIQVGGTTTFRISITTAPTSGTVNTSVSFTASASGGNPPYSFTWNFGDNTGNQVGGAANPNTITHTYTTPGTLTVNVNVTDSTGAKASASTTIVISTPPTSQAFVGVWNTDHSTSNITVTDGSLGPGTTFTVNVNVTNAPLFNAFETALFYDPTNLTLTSFDIATGTIFSNPLLAEVHNSTGAFRIGVVNLGQAHFEGNGALLHLTFKVRGFGASPLVLAPYLPDPSQAAFGADGFTPDWTRLVITGGTSTNPVETNMAITNGYFRNIAGPHRFSPIASFGLTPSLPTAKQTIRFDATASFDPDNSTGSGIRSYVWDFGAQTPNGTSGFTARILTSYPLSGNYTVLLTVVDTDTGYMGMKTMVITIGPALPTVDFSINASPSSLTVTQGTTTSAPILLLTSLNGFAGTVTISGSLLPGGFTILFNSTSSLSVSLTAGQTTHIVITVATFASTPLGIFEETITASSTLSNGMSVVHTTRVLIMVISPPADQPPVASFTFSPQTPGVGQTVSFDASSSFDPDGFIVSENWNFGDGQTGFGRFSFHTYNAPGNYTVTLTVTDNGGLSTTTTEIVPVHMMPPHDVAIDFVDTNPTTAVATQKVAIAVGIENTGSRDATVNITAFWDHNVAGTLQDVTVPANFGPFHQIFVYSITWDTTGVPIGNHTISAKISLVDDPTPADNSFTDGQVTILPPPTLTITPNSGSLGAKIVVKGTGFPSDFFGPQFTFIEVTFDDMFLGFVTTTNGTFSFTFDVPHSQPGPHLIKAFDQISGAHTSATFQVLPEPGSLVVTVNTAAVYFPGDTATIYVLTTIDGSPTGPNGLQIQLTLVRPNGSTATLKVVSASPGLYKATYSIPKTNSTGTYTLVVTAHRTGTTDTLALSGFEVQPTWLSTHGPAIIGGTTIAGALGGIALAWRKGIFRKNNGEPTSGLEAE